MSGTSGPPPLGRHESLWLATTPTTDYGPLENGLSVDTVVVGGGIAGVTTAAKLVDAGQSVALVERDRLLRATTGHTTAKLTSLHGLPYARLVDRFGERTARLYARANEAAIHDVAETVDRLGVDCDFRRAPAYTFVEDASMRDRVREEAAVAGRLGLDASFVGSTELPFDVAGAVKVENQAHFHPRRFLLALANEIPGEDSYVFERTRVTDVDDGAPCTVTTDRGEIRADDVVVATNFPIVDPALYFSRLHPRRSYVLAARLEGPPPEGMYYREGEQYFSVRPYAAGDGPMALFGGQNHRTGDERTGRYEALEATVRDRFDVASIEYRWSTQDYVSVDRVPFVGELAPQTDHVYVATGFGGWGMTGGTVAGILLRDLVLGRATEWDEVYSPARLTLRASARSLASHNAEATRRLVGDRLRDRETFESVDLSPGEAEVVTLEGDRVALYRDEDGGLYATSATCTHMGCVVAWNGDDRSWDCPCHGSRFDVDGTVLDPPAVDGLTLYATPEDDPAAEDESATLRDDPAADDGSTTNRDDPRSGELDERESD